MVFKGYWRMPEKTAAEFKADGFFITGDLGKIDGRGREADHRRFEHAG
jgi:malonyl-CoA/methylmalonyl-CoA synthetase